MESIINNFSGMRVDGKLIKRISKKFGRKKWIVSVSFVTKRKIRDLNRKYRRKDKPTDVLSFGMKEGRLLGDVVICPQVAKANAKKFGTSHKAEIARLAAHGMLHLLGLDHGSRMFRLQDRIMKGVGYA
jgi:probable rRNA maturation factor